MGRDPNSCGLCSGANKHDPVVESCGDCHRRVCLRHVEWSGNRWVCTRCLRDGASAPAPAAPFSFPLPSALSIRCYEQPLTHRPTFAGVRTLRARLMEVSPFALPLMEHLVTQPSPLATTMARLAEGLHVTNDRETRLRLWSCLEALTVLRVVAPIGAACVYGPPIAVIDAEVVTEMNGRVLRDVGAVTLAIGAWLTREMTPAEVLT